MRGFKLSSILSSLILRFDSAASYGTEFMKAIVSSVYSDDIENNRNK